MGFEKIVEGVFSYLLSSGESTYKSMSHNHNLSREERENAREYAEEYRNRRNTLKEEGLSGYFNSFDSSDDD